MTILEELIRYSEDCISGKIISCRKHKWACMRFLRDVESMRTDPEYPFTWNEDRAKEIVVWFSMLRHRTGILAGKPINLTTWQKFRHCQLYGWRRKADGRKRFTKSFTEVARKNAKSQDEAGIALFEISVESTRHGEIYEYYTAGVKKDQSRKVFDEARYMLNGSPLRRRFKVTRNEITHIKSGSFIKMLSKDDSKNGDGSNPAGLILDEYHEHPNTDYYDLFMGANAQEPLLMIITTAGKNLTYPAFTQEYKYCSKILDPNVDVSDETYLADILELDPEDYENLRNVYRPSHADFTYEQKYGIRDHRGGGRSSARETISRVVAGAFAKLALRQLGINIKAYTQQVGDIVLPGTYLDYNLDKTEENAVRCPDENVAEEMSQLILRVKAEGDTIGGVIACVISGCPVGLGEPVYDKLQAKLGAAMLSINAVKGFEYGLGFAGSSGRGREQNDTFVPDGNGGVTTTTNNSGGIQGYRMVRTFTSVSPLSQLLLC